MHLLVLILELLGILLLLSLSGFFSGSETALFSLRRWKVERLKGSSLRGAAVAELLANPRSLIATIICCNESVNIAASNIAAIIRRDYFAAYGTAGVIAVLIAMTLLLFFFGEVTPKIIAIYNSERWALHASIPLKYIHKAIFPLRRTVERIAYTFDRFFMKPGAVSSEGMGIAELRYLVKQSVGEADLTQDDVTFIDAIFDMTTMPVKTMMTPRPRIVALKEDDTLEEALATAQTMKFSRFPVYREDLDGITGIVYAKELLAARYDISSIRSVQDIMHPVLFMPETKNAFDALRDFQVNQIHCAVLLDEYGGTAGIITIDDILREVVGDMGDSFRPFKYRFERVSDGVLIVDGSISIQEFNELSGCSFEDPDVETIAGYLVKEMGRIPSEGEHVKLHQFSFRVLKMAGKRISLIEFRKPDSSDLSRDG